MVVADSYDRRIQLGASHRRYEDALVLYKARRWNGAIYLAGYAIECSLKSLICYTEGTSNFKETKMFQDGAKGATLHNIRSLLKHAGFSASVMAALDPKRTLNEACKTVIELWEKDELRYGNKVGNENDSKRFMDAVEVLHDFIVERLEQLKRRRKFYE